MDYSLKSNAHVSELEAEAAENRDRGQVNVIYDSSLPGLFCVYTAVGVLKE